ncbi:unnamed protein product [Urochloa humidicola]
MYSRQIEDLIQAANAAGMLPQINDNPKQVIDEGAPSDDSINQLPAPIQDLNELNAVQVFIPMNNGVPLQMIPDEVQPEELLGHDQHVEDHDPMLAPDMEIQAQPDALIPPQHVASEQGLGSQGIQQKNQGGGIQGIQANSSLAQNQEVNHTHDMQFGFVHLFEPPVDPGLASRLPAMQNYTTTDNPEVVRAWAKHFTPGNGAPTVSIPHQWADFFTAMLMNPGSFQWAKSFLSSNAVKALNKNNQPAVLFSLPDKCPSKDPLLCLAKLPTEEDMVKELSPCSPPPASNSTSIKKGKEDSSPTTPTEPINLGNGIPSGPWSKAFLAQAMASKNHPAIVDTEVRRSVRKKEQLKGYKHAKSTCEDHNYLGCHKNPPILSPKVIRNLGGSFWKVEDEKLTEKALIKKRKMPTLSGKAPGKAKAGTSKESEDDDKAKKAGKKPPKK